VLDYALSNINQLSDYIFCPNSTFLHNYSLYDNTVVGCN